MNQIEHPMKLIRSKLIDAILQWHMDDFGIALQNKDSAY